MEQGRRKQQTRRIIAKSQEKLKNRENATKLSKKYQETIDNI